MPATMLTGEAQKARKRSVRLLERLELAYGVKETGTETEEYSQSPQTTLAMAAK